MQAIKILVIDDDYIVSRTIERALSKRGFEVFLASRGDLGIELAQKQRPDIIVLDILMPEVDGYAVCQQIRHDTALRETPILFLTGKRGVEDKLEGFRVGADDYLCKPFNTEELILRIRAILKRTNQEYHNEVDSYKAETGKCLRVGGYILNTQTFELETPKNRKIRLTPKQYDLLYHLMSHPGETFTATRLLDEIWDFPTQQGSPDLVRVHIKTLREKVEKNPQKPQFILTMPGGGYTINSSGAYK